MGEAMTPSEIDAMIDDRMADGAFRVHADAFRRRDVYELEMRHIFEGTWVFVGLECQIPNPHDFLTTRIGRQPVIVSRDADGRIHCLLNNCRHRGAVVCEAMQGNKKVHVCPYHGWAYDSAGRNVSVTAAEEGGYTDAFAKLDHGLRQAARVGLYRGFIFASLNPDVAPLEEHLGDARPFLDLAVDQSPDGLELVPGTVTYTYPANWKMQIENSADQYHFVPTHTSYLQIVGSRKPAGPGETRVSFRRQYATRDLPRGSFTFRHGHNALWSSTEDPELRALWLERERVVPRVGETRFKWMLYTRNLLVFPNFQLLETASLQIRINRPLGPDKTEITTFCIAPKGEAREARVRRLRQYEEFYNPSGLATPDDLAVFDACQRGQQSDRVDWHQGYMRGIAELRQGPDAAARELGLDPVTSVFTTGALGDETIFHSQYREWRRLLKKGLGEAEAPRRVALGVAE
jgi:phenylpropionate dioxygenase-like ring-hydroxylating dioxygenase large terminal subunit